MISFSYFLLGVFAALMAVAIYLMYQMRVIIRSIRTDLEKLND